MCNKESEFQGSQFVKNLVEIMTFKYTKCNCLPEKKNR